MTECVIRLCKAEGQRGRGEGSRGGPAPGVCSGETEPEEDPLCSPEQERNLLNGRPALVPLRRKRTSPKL